VLPYISRAKLVRSEDRKKNAHCYPELTYPEMYILEGGYHSFYHSHPTHCVPCDYIRMDAKGFEERCERGLAKLRQGSKTKDERTFTSIQHNQYEGKEEKPTQDVEHVSQARRSFRIKGR
jgi:hypothetical protein